MDGVTTHWLHIWDGKDGKVFIGLNKWEFNAIKKLERGQMQVTYFAGKSATIVTIYDPRYTTREEALIVAEKFVKGYYDHYTVDLANSTYTKKNGIPINPR
jgi:hypothetical protein